MATLTMQKPTLSGIALTYSNCSAGGDEFVNNSGRVCIHVKNGNTAAQTVTVNSQKPCDQGYDHDVVVSIPASSDRLIGPFTTDRFNDANGKVQITYSGVTSMTIAAIEL